MRSPSSEKQKTVFGPRAVPATSSCSEAIATTSPSGESNRPAVERRTTGEPPTTSTPLWSPCSCVTSTRSAVTPSIGRVLELDTARRRAAHVAERVHEDRLLPHEQEC